MECGVELVRNAVIPASNSAVPSMVFFFSTTSRFPIRLLAALSLFSMNLSKRNCLTNITKSKISHNYCA